LHPSVHDERLKRLAQEAWHDWTATKMTEHGSKMFKGLEEETSSLGFLCVHTKFFKSIFYLSLHSLPFFWAKISRDDFGLTEKPPSYP